MKKRILPLFALLTTLASPVPAEVAIAVPATVMAGCWAFDDLTSGEGECPIDRTAADKIGDACQPARLKYTDETCLSDADCTSHTKYGAVCQNGLCRGTIDRACAPEAPNCASGLVCHGGNDKTEYGKCISPTEANCQSLGSCKEGFSCSDNSQCTSRLCDKVCLPKADPNKCKQDHNCPAQEACDNDSQCAPGLFCDNAKGGKCAFPAGAGQCSHHNDCGNGLTCGPDKLCVAANGTSCSAANQCLSNICDGTCRGDVGGDCRNAATECKAGLQCLNNNRCAPAYCPRGNLDSGTDCGGATTDPMCTPLPDRCGAGRHVKASTDCDKALAPNYAGTAGDGFCVNGVTVVIQVTKKNDAEYLTVIGANERKVPGAIVEGAYSLFNDTTDPGLVSVIGRYGANLPSQTMEGQCYVYTRGGVSKKTPVIDLSGVKGCPTN